MAYIKASEETQAKIKEAMAHCIGCNKCKSSCIMLDKYMATPKELFSKELLSIVPFSCTLCDHCRQVCPKDINLSDLFLELRRDFKKQGMSSINVTPIRQHQKNSFSKVFSTQMKLPVERKRVFFPGCSLSSYSPKIIECIYEHINRDDDMALWMKCCGNPTHVIGHQETFENLYTSLKDDFKSQGIEEVIVACQNCYQTISKNSPTLKVTSLYEILNNIGLPKTDHSTLKNIALHDPCPTRHVPIIHESVRSILSKMNIEWEEFNLNRGMTQCCGSGGMIQITNNMLSVSQMSHRAEQVKADTIITYCEECVESMQKGGKKSLHLLDLLFNDKIVDNGYNQKKQSTLTKWQNRFVVKYRVDKIIQKMS